MNIWEILNSPLVLTLIGLVGGSIVATWLSGLWQRRDHQYEVRLECAKNILSIYHEYIRLLKGKQELLVGKEFDSINARLYTQVKISHLVFKNKEIAKQWRSVAGSLANIRQLCLEKSNLVNEKLDSAYDKANAATELMFKEIA